MNQRIKSMVALVGVSTMIALGSTHVYAAKALVRPPAFTPFQSYEVGEKQELTVDDAIKSAVYYNINLKRFELTRENLLRQIDQNYTRDKSIFFVRDWQEANLPEEGTAEYEMAKKQMEEQFNQAMAVSDTTMAKLVSERGSIDMSTVMEREGIGLSIQRLFASIQQKEKDIEVIKQKVAHDGKNMALYEKMFELGKISQSKLQEYTLESSKNTNNLKIQQSKLNAYYYELESMTQIPNIQKGYNLEKIAFEYKRIDFSEATQRAQQDRAADYSAQVASKVADTKIKESVYENYPYVAAESTYWQVKDEKNLAELEKSEAVKNAQYNAQVKYNNIIELQENIALTKKDITKLENQLKDLQTKLKLGLVAKNTVDNSVFGVIEAKNALESMKLQHHQLLQMYENPYFAGMAG